MSIYHLKSLLHPNTHSFTEETRIVLDCAFDKIELILSQANEIKLLTDYHNYLITSLDIDKINLEPFTNQNVNITGFRLVDPESRPAQLYMKKFPNTGRGSTHALFSENALAYDSVWSLAKVCGQRNTDGRTDGQTDKQTDKYLKLWLTV